LTQQHVSRLSAIAFKIKETQMNIAVGDRIPEGEFTIMSDDGPAKMTTAQVFDGKKVVLFAVPGAFTPTCHANHMPGFLENHDAILERGVDTIATVAVNDVHVVHAWEKASSASGKILCLSDGNADFTKAIGMDVDLSIAGMGVRSKRYSMIVEDGVVKHLNEEPSPGQADVSSAATILHQL